MPPARFEGHRGMLVLLLIALVGLTVTARINYLLFHVLVELFAVIVGLVMGVVAFYTRGFSRNDYLTLLGIAYPAVAVLDLIHTLAYKGMGVFADDANLPTQFWIAARGLEAVVLVLAPRYLAHPLRQNRAIAAVTAITLLLLALIGFGAFPTMYIEGSGLTPTKVTAEYAIVALLIVAAYRLWRRHDLLDPEIGRLVFGALALTIVAELFFTVYVGVYDISNLAGHLAKLVSFVLVFIALVRTSLREPFRILSRHSTTYDAIPEEILVVDAAGVIRQVNRLVEERYRGIEIQGHQCHAQFHPADLAQDDCPVCQAIAAGTQASFELYYPQDASWRLLSLAPIAGHEVIRGMVQTIRDITELRRTQVELKRVDRALHAISASNQTLIHARDERSLMQEICTLMVAQGGYSMAWIGFGETLPTGERRLIPQAWAGAEQGYLTEVAFAWDDSPLGRGPAGSAMRTGQVQIANDLATAPAYLPWREAALRRGFAAAMAFPLAVPGGQPLGVLAVYSSEPNVFTAEEGSVLGELAGDLAFGITALRTARARTRAEQEAAHWYQQVAGVFRETVEALSQLVEMRDPYTAGHQQRVARLATTIGRELGFDDQRLEGLYFAGLLHDIGKMQVPADILAHPGRLSNLELQLVRVHPQAGYDLLKDISFPWPVADTVWQHHERIDGSGYPRGIGGDEIMVEAKILAVADVVEAISSHRPYRPALGIDVALDEIRQHAGTHFDATVVDACVRVFHEHNFSWDAPSPVERPPAMRQPPASSTATD